MVVQDFGTKPLDFNLSSESMPHDSETVKLVKNTKGYNWEIKLRADLVAEDTLARLDKINIQMANKYGETQ